ncbi:hypothetical protein CCAL13119_08925 [Campylobacter sp. RM13119]|uniref:XkdF-like putative serine protease domain-containing protein n=1 Tax=Campylobacter TaxID=194 RepID=UPI001473954B|nr:MULTISPECIES: XkdF-like putative serine protease domain-containing protein [unclassified Campylobacter]MBE3607045.1 hypothetical protein [Campylobacter sp. RM13119]
MAVKLKNLNITHISLVKAGANKKNIIYKSSKENPSYEKMIKIAKNDEEKGVIYGIVYSPDEVDTQGETADAKEIEKAAYAFMKGLNGANIDREHDFKPDGAYVAESWIVRENDALFKSEKIGSWAVAIKLENDELKEAVKKGEIAGLSMAGTAQREGVSKSEDSVSIADAISKGFSALFAKFEKKDKGENMEEKDKDASNIEKTLKDGFDRLTDQIDGLEKRIADLETVAKSSKQNENIEKNDNIQGVL